MCPIVTMWAMGLIAWSAAKTTWSHLDCWNGSKSESQNHYLLRFELLGLLCSLKVVWSFSRKGQGAPQSPQCGHAEDICCTERNSGKFGHCQVWSMARLQMVLELCNRDTCQCPFTPKQPLVAEGCSVCTISLPDDCPAFLFCVILLCIKFWIPNWPSEALCSPLSTKSSWSSLSLARMCT